MSMGAAEGTLQEAALLILALALLLILVRASFSWGRSRRSCQFPPSLLAELSSHKRDCLGEPPERVSLELELLFGTSASVSRPEASASAIVRHGASRHRMSSG